MKYSLFIDVMVVCLSFIIIFHVALTHGDMPYIFHLLGAYLALLLLQTIMKTKSETLFNSKKASVIIKSIRIVAVIMLYIIFIESLNIFFLLIFGGVYLMDLLKDLSIINNKKTNATPPAL